MARKINEKDVVVGVAALGLGYLLLTRKSPVEKGGAGGAGEAIKDVGGTVVDDLGGLGVKTPNYVINIPGTGGSFVFPDFPPEFVPQPFIGPEPSDPGHKYDVPFKWPDIIGGVDDLLPGLLPGGVEGFLDFVVDPKAQKEWMKTHNIFGKEIPAEQLASKKPFFGDPKAQKTWMQTHNIFGKLIPEEAPKRTTTVVRGKKGRKSRVSRFKKEFDVPSDYSYPVTGTPIKVQKILTMSK